MTHEEEAEKAAQQMIQEGYIEEYYENGKRMWRITEAGRDYLARLQEQEG